MPTRRRLIGRVTIYGGPPKSLPGRLLELDPDESHGTMQNLMLGSVVFGPRGVERRFGRKLVDLPLSRVSRRQRRAECSAAENNPPACDA